MSDVTHKLEFPFSIGSAQYTEVKIRRPKVAEYRALKTVPEDERDIHTIELLTGLLPAQIDAMDLADFTAINDVVTGFLRNSRKKKA